MSDPSCPTTPLAVAAPALLLSLDTSPASPGGTAAIAPVVAWLAAGVVIGVLAAAVRSRSGGHRSGTTAAIADEVAARLREQRQAELVTSTRLDARLEALGSDIGRLTGLVRALETDRAEQLGTLGRHLEETLRTTSELGATTRDLSRLLANDRARGQWGERMAEDVLRAAGLVEGVNYVVRRRLPGGGVPDVTVLLPQGRSLHMDVKFPLANYARFLRAEDDAAARRHRSAFLRDARQRIREIAERDYLHDHDSVGVALLLIPNEAVFSFLQQEAAELFDEAMRAGIAVCSPLTLFAVLAVVRQAVDAAHLAESSEEIRRCLDAVERQWRRHVGGMEKVGSHLRNAVRAHEELSGPGRRRMDEALDAVTLLRRGPHADERFGVVDGAGDERAPPVGTPEPSRSSR